MVEPEMAFADLDELMALAENFISFIVGRVLERRASELKVIERDVTKLETIKAPFPKISYDEAVTMLHDAHAKGLIENKFEYGDDFGSPGRDVHFITIRSAGDGASLSRERKGFLHGA